MNNKLITIFSNKVGIEPNKVYDYIIYQGYIDSILYFIISILTGIWIYNVYNYLNILFNNKLYIEKNKIRITEYEYCNITQSWSYMYFLIIITIFPIIYCINNFSTTIMYIFNSDMYVIDKLIEIM